MLQGAEFKPSTRLVLIVYFQAPYCNNHFFFHLTKTSTNIQPTLWQNHTTTFIHLTKTSTNIWPTLKQNHTTTFFFHLTKTSIDIWPTLGHNHTTTPTPCKPLLWPWEVQCEVGCLDSCLPWPGLVVLAFCTMDFFSICFKKEKKIESLYSYILCSLVLGRCIDFNVSQNVVAHLYVTHRLELQATILDRNLWSQTYWHLSFVLNSWRKRQTHFWKNKVY